MARNLFRGNPQGSGMWNCRFSFELHGPQVGEGNYHLLYNATFTHHHDGHHRLKPQTDWVDLQCSRDGQGIFRNPNLDPKFLTKNGWLHVDMDDDLVYKEDLWTEADREVGTLTIQGMLNLLPADETTPSSSPSLTNVMGISWLP